MVYLCYRPKGAYGVPVQYERSFRWKLGQFRYLCQHNSLPGHVKVTVSRDNLFEDSFAQVCKTIQVSLDVVNVLISNLVTCKCSTDFPQI